MRRGLLILLAVFLATATAAAETRPERSPGQLVEVVVTLEAAPLAQARLGRTVSARGSRRLSLRAPASVSYLRTLAAAQRSLEARIEAAVPGAQVRRRYRVVANGLAVVVPAGGEARLAAVAGVARVYPSVRYRPTLDRSPQQIGATAVWGPARATAGQGLKIGIIDEGIDQTHPFFDPAGYAFPPGYPKGQQTYTSAKVIVARAFPPAGVTWKHAAKPFDPEFSSHGTHVAGIAAGNPDTAAQGARVSGVAPRAYLGNYKALTIPTDSDVGLDGNSPELVAAIEAAVKDGMDVINLSLGEPQIEPSRDIVALALDAAADAGVIPVVAAGNNFDEFGRGSIGSPGTSAKAITVGAVTTSRGGTAGVVADFSSSGPSPLSLGLKPDVAAPGSQILSAAPRSAWTTLSGTSMASPHVAGAAALLLQRHPTWTVAELKSALTSTGDASYLDGSRAAEAPTTREGGGVVNLARADVPLVFASPSVLSFGFLRRGTTVPLTVAVSDGGGGAGDWAVTIEQLQPVSGVSVSAPPALLVPGNLAVTASTTANAAEGELTGFVVLNRGSDRRRIPFWLRATAPALGAAKTTALVKPGLYRGNTKGRPSLVVDYRYPERAPGALRLPGPEQVFRFRLARAAANFGVVVTKLGPGASIEPRIVVAGDENRLVGFTSLPFDLNPYLRTLDQRVLAAGAVRPVAGTYDIVFDSVSPGAFTFRFWVDDTTPPAVAVRSATVRRGAPVTLVVTDRGSGVYPRSLVVRVDGEERRAGYAAGRVTIPTTGLAPGRHALIVQISDYQETRNMENVARILPNTRFVRTTFRVR